MAAAAAPAAPRVVLEKHVERALAGQIEPANPEVRDTLADWECPMCLDLAFCSAKMTACGHVFHAECIEQAWADKEQCPVCNSTVAPGESRWKPIPQHVFNMLDRTKVKCPQNCGAEMRFDLLRVHVTQLDADAGCPNTTFHCPSAECTWAGKRPELDGHLARCPTRYVPCEKCTELRKRKSMQRHHKSECTRRKIDCDSCGLSGVPAFRMPAHLHDDCTGPIEKREAVRLQSTLEQRDSEIAALKEAVLQATRPLPPAYAVTSAEHPALNGKYKLVPGMEQNACPVWACGPAFLMKRADGGWQLTTRAANHLHSLSARSKASLRPVVGEPWQTPGGEPAPGTSLQVAPASPSLVDRFKARCKSLV